MNGRRRTRRVEDEQGHRRDPASRQRKAASRTRRVGAAADGVDLVRRLVSRKADARLGVVRNNCPEADRSGETRANWNRDSVRSHAAGESKAAAKAQVGLKRSAITANERTPADTRTQTRGVLPDPRMCPFRTAKGRRGVDQFCLGEMDEGVRAECPTVFQDRAEDPKWNTKNKWRVCNCLSANLRSFRSSNEQKLNTRHKVMWRALEALHGRFGRGAVRRGARPCRMVGG